MQISSALQSQTISKNAIGFLLTQIGRNKWVQKYSVHDLTIEPWATGVWVKQAGLVSYKVLAETLKLEAEMKAEHLPVEKVDGGYWVKSHQCSDRYFVTFNKTQGWECECLRYKCWKKRMKTELPQLLNQFNGKVFCHHIVAAYKFSKL